MEPPEQIFEQTYAGNWLAVLRIIQEHGIVRRSDPVFIQAVETFMMAFTAQLPPWIPDAPGEENPGYAFTGVEEANIAERILLFFSSRRLTMADEQLTGLVRRSLHFWSGNHEKVRGIAQIIPNDPICAAILGSDKQDVVSTVSGSLVRDNQPRVDHGRQAKLRSIFRSRQEKAFFDAVKANYPQHLVCPNVSLNAIIEFDTIRGMLTRTERTFFHRALVDCVIFARDIDFLPRLAFELDSPLHEDAFQIERDGMKDRILSLVGLRLVRIHPQRAHLGVRDFLALLRNAHVDIDVAGDTKNHPGNTV